jgi:hypothetical protein
MPGDPPILRGGRASQRSGVARLKWRAGLRRWILTRLLEGRRGVFFYRLEKENDLKEQLELL